METRFNFFSTKLCFCFGVNDTVDLFASRVNNHLARYVALKPDPRAWKIDAFLVNRTYFSGYWFPSFLPYRKSLAKN